MRLLEVYLGSNELKKLIVEKSEQFRIPLQYGCVAAGIEHDKFMESYINAKVGKPVFNEEQFDKLLQCYGIEIRFTAVIKKDFDHEKMKLELRKKYESSQK